MLNDGGLPKAAGRFDADIRKLNLPERNWRRTSLALIIRPFNFESELPTMQELRECAEKIGGLALQSKTDHGGSTDFEFDFLRGIVHAHKSRDARRSREAILLRSNTGDAPVLLELLSLALEELGGKPPGKRGVDVELQLPLTEGYVTSKTGEFRKSLGKAVRQMWVMVLGPVVLALAAISLVVWAAWYWLFGR